MVDHPRRIAVSFGHVALDHAMNHDHSDLLEEMADEQRWQRSFAQSQDALAKLAAEALEEDAQGRTLDLDESL